MNWKLLKDGLCPKCGGKLASRGGFLDPLIGCTGVCDFTIHDHTLERILERIAPAPRAVRSPIDRDTELSNLGHKVVADDFSDSPHI